MKNALEIRARVLVLRDEVALAVNSAPPLKGGRDHDSPRLHLMKAEQALETAMWHLLEADAKGWRP